MPTSDEIHNALIAIHSRLGTIEGRVTLLARAERDGLLAALCDVVRTRPLTGQLYLLLDGRRNQTEILRELGKAGVESSAMSVSRAVVKMHTEYGIAELVAGGRNNIFRKATAAETVLNLSKNIEAWLTEGGHVVPGCPKRRRRKDA
jgi:hypothetical protein